MVEPHSSNAAPCCPIARWEWGVVCGAVAVALALGFSNLGAPSLWHDECFQVFLAKSLGETGAPSLPSGKVLYTGALFNGLIAGFIGVFGNHEVSVRAPSVLFGGLNVLLAYLVFRRLLGRWTALVAALALALSPWHVAWSRQARFYEVQATLYLLMLAAVWRYGQATGRRTLGAYLLAGAAAYAAAAQTALHSVIFLAPVGIFAGVAVVQERSLRSRWGVLGGLTVLGGCLTLLVYVLALDPVYAHTIWKDSGMGGKPVNETAIDPLYYFRFLWLNHSRGMFLIALAGFTAMLFRNGRAGLFVCLGFWVPVLILNYFFGYQQHRFMYFTFPFFLAAFSFGLVEILQFMAAARRSHWRRSVALCLAIFLALTAVSATRLVADSLNAASGANTTLARRHPQWRKPCEYVREHLDGAVVVTTTYLPTLYYVGRADTWFPERFLPFEIQESGFHGLNDLNDFKAYVAAHPRGYFVAEWWRYWRNADWPGVKAELAWIEENLDLIEEACSEDVRVYAWGFGTQPAR